MVRGKQLPFFICHINLDIATGGGECFSPAGTITPVRVKAKLNVAVYIKKN